MFFICEGIIICKFDEGFGPELFDVMNFVDDVSDGFARVAGCEEDGTGAEIALVGAAARGLNSKSVIFVDIEKVESGYG